VVLDQPLVPRALYGNYEAPRFVFATRFWPFLPLWFAANPDLLPGDSDKVTGTAIIREINIARQNPTLYANFLEQTRQNYVRSGSPDAGQTPRVHSGGCPCSG
jgi:hypothetical protein